MTNEEFLEQLYEQLNYYTLDLETLLEEDDYCDATVSHLEWEITHLEQEIAELEEKIAND